MAVLNAVESSLECGDLARMDAAAVVVQSIHRDGVAAARTAWSQGGTGAGSFVDWLSCTAAIRHVDRCLKLSTGRNRAEWWSVT